MTKKSIPFLTLLFLLCVLTEAKAENGFDDAMQRVRGMNADSSGMAFFPGGSTLLGNNTGDQDEMPEHQVTLNSFYLDKHEVSNADYNNYLRGVTPPLPSHSSGENLDEPEQPVVRVSWYEADAYCRSKGKRLPSEAEFEHVARLLGISITKSEVAFIDRDDYEKAFNFFGRKDKFDYTAPVTEFKAASVEGVVNLLGNVWEWMSDWYGPYEPTGEASAPQQYKVLRGGSWENTPSKNYQTFRAFNTPQSKTEFYGFRCALDAPR